MGYRIGNKIAVLGKRREPHWKFKSSQVPKKPKLRGSPARYPYQVVARYRQGKARAASQYTEGPEARLYREAKDLEEQWKHLDTSGIPSGMAYGRRKSRRPSRRPARRFKKRYAAKRRSYNRRGGTRVPFSRLSVGLNVPAKQLVKMRFVSDATLKYNALANILHDEFGDGPAGLIQLKANSIRFPFQMTGRTTSNPNEYSRLFNTYKRVHVFKSTCTILNTTTVNVNVAGEPAQGVPVLVGINLRATSAGHQRGKDARGLFRDQVLSGSGLMKSGRPTVMKGLSDSRNAVTATYMDRRFFRATQTGKEDRTMVDGGDPAALAEFQPWICMNSGDGATAAFAQLSVRITLTYHCIASEKVFDYTFDA